MKHSGPLAVIVLVSLVVAYLFSPAAPWSHYQLLRAAAILLVAVPAYFVAFGRGRERLEPGGNAATGWRRWLQFSLRTLLLLTLLLALYLGLYCERARRQKEAVASLAKTCSFIYESDLAGVPARNVVWADMNRWGQNVTAETAFNWSWLQRALAERLGADYVDRVVAVRINSYNVDEALPHLKKLPYLRRVYMWPGRGIGRHDEEDFRVGEKLQRELPHVEVWHCCGAPPVVG